MSGRPAEAPRWPSDKRLEELADAIQDVPVIEPTPDAEPHITRARLHRAATATRSQAVRRDDLAGRVALAILARLPLIVVSLSTIADQVGADVADVREALADLTASGLLVEPTDGRIDVLTPALVDRFTATASEVPA